jgi:hypothetical protein
MSAPFRKSSTPRRLQATRSAVGSAQRHAAQPRPWFPAILVGVLRTADYPPPVWRGPLAVRSIRAQHLVHLRAAVYYQGLSGHKVTVR